jgi:hypothetical protein
MANTSGKLDTFVEAALLFRAGVIDESTLKEAAFQWLSEDAQIVPNLLGLLAAERAENRELVLDMNMQLTMQTFLQTANKRSKGIRQLVESKVAEVHGFYQKWAHRIRPNLDLKPPAPAESTNQ